MNSDGASREQAPGHDRRGGVHERASPDESAEEIGATRPLLDTGVVDVADDGDVKLFGGTRVNDERRVKNEEWHCQ